MKLLETHTYYNNRYEIDEETQKMVEVSEDFDTSTVWWSETHEVSWTYL
jgi:hypothetical protein